MAWSLFITVDALTTWTLVGEALPEPAIGRAERSQPGMPMRFVDSDKGSLSEQHMLEELFQI